MKIDSVTRWKLHLATLVALFFLTVYNKQICPFLDGLPVGELLGNLVLVVIFQIAVRELLFRYIPRKQTISWARQGYYISILSWVLAGVVAGLFHYFRYPEIPLASHLKLLSGYWVLGAAILGQWEHVMLERAARLRIDVDESQAGRERISRRIVECFFLFTLAPSLVMLLVVMRYIFEGRIDSDVAVEVAYIGLFCVAIALIVARQYGRQIQTDTQLISEGLQKVGQGEFDVRLDDKRPDDLGEIAKGINQMSVGLQQRERIKEAFGRFVAPEVAQRFIAEHIDQDQSLRMGGERREVVVLMADIRGFTPMSESMEPEELTGLLNAYFSEMVAAIHANGGMVDKFIGDAIMAVFGVITQQEDAAIAAVRTGQEMLARLRGFNEQRIAVEKPVINIGIGIHRGEVVAGYIGSPDRLEFTVIGEAVNIAARIESQAKTPQPSLLFSEAIAEEVGDVLPIRHIVTTRLKGVSLEMALYGIEDEA